MKTAIAARANFFIIGFCLFKFGLGIAPAQTTNTCISPLNSDFLSKFTVVEVVEYVQTNAAGPVLDGSNAFGFEAVIKLSTNMTASTAIVTIPPTQQPSLMIMDDSHQFILGALTNSFSNLTAAFPDGTYEFTISDNTIPVPLPADSGLPNAPTLSTYAADQSIDATNDFTLSWNPFNGGGPRDLIIVDLTAEFGGAAFQTPAFGCPGQLDGTATSVLIPANTLTTNTTYRVEIEFVKILTFDTNSIPGDALLAGTEADLQSTISTGSGLAAAPAPSLANAAWLPGGSVRFDFTTTPGLTYTVQFNQDLSNPTGWTPLLTTNAAANSVPFTNSPPSGATDGYYRVVQQ